MKNNTLVLGLIIMGVSLFLFFGNTLTIITRMSDKQEWKGITFYGTGATALQSNYDEIKQLGTDPNTAGTGTAEIRLTEFTGSDGISKIDAFTGFGGGGMWAVQKVRSDLNINRINKFIMTGYTGNSGALARDVPPQCNSQAIICIKELNTDFFSAVTPTGFVSNNVDENVAVNEFFTVPNENSLLCLVQNSITENKDTGQVYSNTQNVKYGSGSINNLVFEKSSTEWILRSDNGFMATIPINQVNIASQHILEFYQYTGSDQYACPSASIRSLYSDIVVDGNTLGLPVEPTSNATLFDPPKIPFIDYPIFEQLPEALMSANQTVNGYVNSYFGLIGLAGLLLSGYAVFGRR